jgi:hypothetical protein
MPQARTLSDLMKIRIQNRKNIEDLDGILGTALGLKKRTGQPLSKEPAIIIFVSEKVNPKWLPKDKTKILPKKLKGPNGLWCTVDFVEGGKAESMEIEPVSADASELSERLRGWDNKIWAGSQISHWIDEDRKVYNIGTLAAFARRRSDGALGFLTNRHIAVERGKEIYHPLPRGTLIGLTEDTLEFFKHSECYGSEFEELNAYVKADCAFVELSTDLNWKDINPHLMGVGQLGEEINASPMDMDITDIIGQKVLHVGRTTGMRRGIIAAFAYEYEDEDKNKKYTDLLIAGNDRMPFSGKGDSGSLIVLDNGLYNPVGLIWGGWQEKLRTGYAQENWTYGVSLFNILKALDLKIVRRRSDIRKT